MEKLNGLDLFSGIGGIGLALSDWVRTVAYCEQDPYAQGVLLSRMRSGDIDKAPIWDDVRTLQKGRHLPRIDIIFGGFPCQDISVAGSGKGLGGKRSGLFFEIVRLARECRPKIIFLENVPVITIRGLDRVLMELTALGYDCRWTVVSAAEVGAPHQRDRWFLMAYSNSNGKQPETERRNFQRNGIGDSCEEVANTCGAGWKSRGGGRGHEKEITRLGGSCEIQNPNSTISEWVRPEPHWKQNGPTDASWWSVEPDVGRVVDGLSYRVDRVRCLGNSVVPLSAKTAFERLSGLK